MKTFFQEDEVEIYKEFYVCKQDGEKYCYDKTAEKLGFSRAKVADVVKNIDNNNFNEKKAYKLFLKETLDIKWRYRFSNIFHELPEDRKRTTVEQFGSLVKDMILSGFTEQLIGELTGKQHKLINHYVNNVIEKDIN